LFISVSLPRKEIRESGSARGRLMRPDAQF
jgi:hypothetical protein